MNTCDVCKKQIKRGPVYFDRKTKTFYCDRCYLKGGKKK